jgi:hypothetical protein
MELLAESVDSNGSLRLDSRVVPLVQGGSLYGKPEQLISRILERKEFSSSDLNGVQLSLELLKIRFICGDQALYDAYKGQLLDCRQQENMKNHYRNGAELLLRESHKILDKKEPHDCPKFLFHVIFQLDAYLELNKNNYKDMLISLNEREIISKTFLECYQSFLTNLLQIQCAVEANQYEMLVLPVTDAKTESNEIRILLEQVATIFYPLLSQFLSDLLKNPAQIKNYDPGFALLKKAFESCQDLTSEAIQSNLQLPANYLFLAKAAEKQHCEYYRVIPSEYRSQYLGILREAFGAQQDATATGIEVGSLILKLADIPEHSSKSTDQSRIFASTN